MPIARGEQGVPKSEELRNRFSNGLPMLILSRCIGERYAQIGIGNSFAEIVEENGLSYKTAYITT